MPRTVARAPSPALHVEPCLVARITRAFKWANLAPEEEVARRGDLCLLECTTWMFEKRDTEAFEIWGR